MKDQINYQALFELENDIRLQQERSPAFALFNREKIRRFYQNAGYRLQVLDKTITELQQKYVKKDEEGKFVTKEENGRTLWVFETEADEKGYLAEWNMFMQITFYLNI